VRFVGGARLVYRSGSSRVRERPEGSDNPHPDRHAGVVTIFSELVDPSWAFRLGVVAVVLEHQVGDPPNVDLGLSRGESCTLPVYKSLKLEIVG